MNQHDFDKDLLVTGDDTLEDLVPLPEQEDGYGDNPIRRIFEQIDPVDVKYEDDDDQ